MSTGWLFTKQERITEGRRVVQHSTLHHSSQRQKPEAKRGKGKRSESQGFSSHLTCDRTYCDLLKTIWNKGKAQLVSSVVSGGDSKKHSPLSAVLGLEGRAG